VQITFQIFYYFFICKTFLGEGADNTKCKIQDVRKYLLN
jgi:hypothetical protein